MRDGLISIVIPLFNKEREILRAIRSVQRQTVRDFEVIIVNDGSTDRGPEIVRHIDDDRIRVVDQSNIGASGARNRGISEALADLIAFLDADDEWLPDYLETILKLADKYPEASVYATGYYIGIGNSRRPSLIRGLPDNFADGILEDYFLMASNSDPPVWTSAVVVRRDALKAVNGFPSGIIAGEDLLTWARLAMMYKIAYSCECKAIFFAPLRMDSRPSRIPQVPDLVADGLMMMLNDEKVQDRKHGLLNYIGLWHRMRAVVYIKLGRGHEARAEIRTALKYSGRSVRLLLLDVLTFLPQRLQPEAYHFLIWMRNLFAGHS